MVSINKIIPSSPTKAIKSKNKQKEKPLNEASIRYPELKENPKQDNLPMNHIDEKV